MSELNMGSELKYYEMHADPDCSICDGLGLVQVGTDETDECVCVRENRAEIKSEMLMDLITN
jgi:hypothetical protein